jgi:hypothetical protein
VKFESRYARIAEIAAEVRANSREIARINLRGRGLRENLMQPLAYTISDAAILHDNLMEWPLSLPLDVPTLHRRDKVSRATAPGEITRRSIARSSAPEKNGKEEPCSLPTNSTSASPTTIPC